VAGSRQFRSALNCGLGGRKYGVFEVREGRGLVEPCSIGSDFNHGVETQENMGAAKAKLIAKRMDKSTRMAFDVGVVVSVRIRDDDRVTAMMRAQTSSKLQPTAPQNISTRSKENTPGSFLGKKTVRTKGFQSQTPAQPHQVNPLPDFPVSMVCSALFSATSPGKRAQFFTRYSSRP
jgi:hypothetical protein